MTEHGWNRLDVNLAKTQALYVRTGCFLRHPQSELVVPKKSRLCFSRIANQMFFLFRVKGCSFSITTPFDDARIASLVLKSSDIMFIKLDHVLAFSVNMFPRRKWRFDYTSFITKQLGYVYFKGPGTLFYFGLGHINTEQLKDAEADYDQGSVIGWSNTLSIGASTKSSVLSSLLNKEDICLDRFVGSGWLITQASTTKKLPKRFHDTNDKSNWVDYLSALLGLRI